MGLIIHNISRPILTFVWYINYNSFWSCLIVSDMVEKQLLEPDEETHCPKELERSLNRLVTWNEHILAHVGKIAKPTRRYLCCRSKRSRRGPVIEADGMLKMFHCPYEGCSQVYVAISSFQVRSPECTCATCGLLGNPWKQDPIHYNLL